MSIVALVDEDLARSEPSIMEQRLRPVVEAAAARIGERIAIDSQGQAVLSKELATLAEEEPIKRSSSSNAMDALTRFIPTEAVTLYVAAAAALPSLEATFPRVDSTAVYWAFAVLTPALHLLLMVGKRSSARLPLLPAPSKLPWFKLVACTIAFLVWALALPSSPYLTSEHGKVVAGFGALLVSTFLSLLEPIFTRPAST